MRKAILVVSSIPLLREVLCEELERQDYSVAWATDIQAAIRTTSLRRTDLLLIDLDGQPADGVRILSQIAVINPELQMVVLTRHAELQTAVLCSGVAAVAEKPIDLRGLFRLTHELITQEPKDRGRFRVVPQSTVDHQDNRQNRLGEPSSCPTEYRGWGINE